MGWVDGQLHDQSEKRKRQILRGGGEGDMSIVCTMGPGLPLAVTTQVSRLAAFREER